MPIFKTMTCPLRASPLQVRLTAIVGCFLVCCAIAATGMQLTHHTSFTILFVLPVLLASWCFQQRGAVLSVGGVLLALVVLNTLMTGSLYWPPSLLLTFTLGGFALIVIGAFVSFLSYALDLSHQARLRAQQAEERHQELYRIRNQFLLNVSHELRTPLAQLQGYLELLRDHRERLDAATQAHFLDRAFEGSEELCLLVNSVLDAAQTTNGMRPPQCEVFSVVEVVQDTLSHVDPQTRQAYPLHLDVLPTLAVRADAQYTRQVLRILLSNAFKYSPRQTAVVISAALCEREENGSVAMVRLCVKDAGLGIPPDEAPLLFKQFVRLQRDLSGPIQGTGLGLYISNQLVEAMGGRIWVESPGIPGQGSCFCFTLPHAPSPPQGDKAPTP